MTWTNGLATVVVAFAATIASLWAIRKAVAYFPHLFADRPNWRSMHSIAVPRIGGIGMAGGLIASWMLWKLCATPVEPLASIFVLSAVLFFVSVVDDLFPLPSGAKLVVHLFASAAMVTSFLGVQLLPDTGRALPIIGAVVAVAWGTNLNNFMDGADGLAGGMALIGFATIAIASMDVANSPAQVACLSLAVSGAAAGFLVFNFPPAKVFMGDAGSIPIGFMAATISFVGFLEQIWPWWFGPVVFLAFVSDATVTLMRRILTCKQFWQPHREHYYQRLIRSGWSHRKTCVVYYFLMLLSAFCALSAKNSPRPWTWLLPLVITFVSLIALLEWRFHQEKKDGKKSGSG